MKLDFTGTRGLQSPSLTYLYNLCMKNFGMVNISGRENIFCFRVLVSVV